MRAYIRGLAVLHSFLAPQDGRVPTYSFSVPCSAVACVQHRALRLSETAPRKLRPRRVRQPAVFGTPFPGGVCDPGYRRGMAWDGGSDRMSARLQVSPAWTRGGPRIATDPRRHPAAPPYLADAQRQRAGLVRVPADQVWYFHLSQTSQAWHSETPCRPSEGPWVCSAAGRCAL